MASERNTNRFAVLMPDTDIADPENEDQIDFVTSKVIMRSRNPDHFNADQTCEYFSTFDDSNLF